jgi:RNA polymerase sigma-70 factor (ECF subfamily)
MAAVRRGPEERAASMVASRDRLAGLYAEYRPWAVRFISGRVQDRDRHVAEDLAQDTFLQAWPTLASAEFTAASPPRPWLATIARRVVADHYRCGSGLQRAAETPVAEDSPVWQTGAAAPQAGPADDVVADRRAAALTAALDGLPVQTRRVLELRYLQGRSRREAAQDMGRGTATVDRRAAAGLAALRGDAVLEAAATVREDPLDRARRAVAQVHERVAVPGAHVAEEGRARQLARWHADDQAAAAQRRGDDRGLSVLAAEGGAP